MAALTSIESIDVHAISTQSQTQTHGGPRNATKITTGLINISATRVPKILAYRRLFGRTT